MAEAKREWGETDSDILDKARPMGLEGHYEELASWSELKERGSQL